MTTTHTEQQADGAGRIREASTFEVFNRANRSAVTSHGVYDTLDEARGCVEFDHLTDFEIWQGDHIVEEQGDDSEIVPESNDADDDDSFPDTLTGGIDADV